MEYSLFQNIISYSAYLSEIPFRIYDKQGLIHTSANDESVFAYFSETTNSLLQAEKNIAYAVTNNLLLFGMVRDSSSELTTVIGPVTIVALNESALRDLAIRNNLTAEQSQHLLESLNATTSFPFTKFIAMLCTLYMCVEQKNISINEVVSEELENELNRSVNAAVITETDPDVVAEESRFSYDFESRMMFLISHGMVEELEKLTSGYKTKSVGKIAFDSLRQLKNSLIILNSLSSRAAIAGGLDPDFAYKLAEIYIQKIESCTSFAQMEPLSRHIRLDYCKRVRDIAYPVTNDLIVNKAVKYVSQHLTQKISVQDIADNLHISCDYLADKFKKTMHILPSEFISRLKIQEAQYLLLYTNQSLVQISNYLSFSSQSYFQNVFKKIVGCTPLDYRTHNRDQVSFK